MRNNKGARGAVSVFLALILVPCIVASSLFVDLSRVHLSKATAESSADLALNALLTNYDADLKEWYGMMGSCQKIGDYYENAKKYFLRNLASQDMQKTELMLLSDQFSSVTSDGKIHDLLDVSLAEGSAVSIAPVGGANLTNATLIKDQIIEFMKFRAPIEITTGLIERLKSDPTLDESLKADKNKPLVESKEEFYESESVLLEGAYYTYLALTNYTKKVTTLKLSNDTISGVYSDLAAYKATYQEILNKTVANLSNTGSLSRFNRYTISLTYYHDYYSNPDRKFSEVYSEKKKEDGEYVYYITLSDAQLLVNDLKTKISTFNSAKKNFGNAAKSLCDKLPVGNEAGQANGMQWWVQMNSAVVSSGNQSAVSNAAQQMMRAYSKVLAIYECTLKGDIPQGWSSLDDWDEKYGVSDLLTQVENLQNTYLRAGVTNNNDAYLKAVKNLESISNSQNGYRTAANNYVTLKGSSVKLTSALSTIATNLTNDRKKLQECVDLLNIIINGDGANTPSLDSLTSYAKTYEDNLDTWTENAKNVGTDMGTSDQKEIEKRAEKGLDIKKADVAALKTRLVNIRSQLQDAIKAIDNLKFGSKSLKDISTIDTFKSCAAVDNSKIKLYNSEIKSYSDSLFSQRFSPATLPEFKHATDDNYNPILNIYNRDVDEVAIPELYKYLHQYYRNVNQEKMEEAKKEKDDFKNAGTDKENGAKTKERYNKSAKEIPHVFSAEGTPGLDGIVELIKKLIALDFTGMRDDLYATTYIMNMFSYATYENEGKYDLLAEKDKDVITKLTLVEGDANYYVTKYETVAGKSADEKGTWASADPMDAYNKTLTNKLINASNNPGYLTEVEYILYGQSKKENVEKAYTTIYAVRYPLNLVSGFQHFFSAASAGPEDDITKQVVWAVAAGVQAMTGGIVPAQLTEAIIIPVLAIFETASDLDRLEAGFPVELYKTKPGHWWVSLSAQDEGSDSGVQASDFGSYSDLTNILNGSTFKRENRGQGLFYSDYLTLMVYLGLNSCEQPMYQRVAEVIQFNLQGLTGNSGYSLANTQMYFRLTAKLRVSPLMIALPYFSYDEYQNELTTKTDWCTYSIDTVRGYS